MKMKKILSFLITLCLFCANANAQGIPTKYLNYQAVIRNNSGDVIANQFVSLRFGIFQDTLPLTIAPVFQEVHVTKTNAFGQVNLVIGKGAATYGIYDTLSWKGKYRYLKIELDADGGTVFKKMGYAQFQTVPYAQVALDAINKPSLGELSNVNTTGAAAGQVLKFNGTNWTPATDATSSGGGGSADNQTLSIVGNQLSISNGNSVTLPTGATYTAGTGINISGSTISNSGDLSNTNEIQTLSLSGTTLSLSNGGGSVSLPAGGGGALNGSGTVGNLTRWTSANTIGDAAIQQDIESNLGVNTIPQTAYKMRIKSALPSQFPLEILGNNVPGAGVQFTLNDATQNAEIRVQSAITNFRTTSERLAFNTRSALALPLTADDLQIRNNGNILMGLFEPMSSSDKLSVYGNIGIQNGSYNFYNNSNAATADISCLEPTNKLHIHSIATNAGIEMISTGGKIELATNGIGGATSEMVIENGKVTIGVTGAATQPKLEVNGQVKINGGTPGAGKVLTSDATGLATWQTPAAGGGSQWTTTGSNIYYNTGSVGIGTATPNPSAKLHVAGQFEVSNASRGMIYDPSTLNDLYFSGGNANITTGSANSNLILQKWTDTKVAIGNITPTQKLDIDGQIRIRGGSPAAGKVLTSGADGTATWENSPVVGSQWSLSGIGVTNSNPTTSVHIKTSALEPLRIEGGSGSYTSIYESGNYRGYIGSFSGDAADVDFGTGSGSFAKTHLVTSAIPRLTVDATGKVGIGTQTPTHPLQMASGAHCTSAGVWTNASDARLKKNISALPYGLAAIMQLKPIAYDMKADNTKQVGFIAQEVQKIIPELISGTEGDLSKGENLGMSYGNLTAILTKAIQEQQAMIEELKKEIATLKKQ
jgi:Chaperone of endosialidase